MLTDRSFVRLLAGIALTATSICSASRLYADEGATETPPAVAPPQAALESKKAQGQGRIIIVEPDGTRREYNFGPEVPAGVRPHFDILMPRSVVVDQDVLMPRLTAIRALADYSRVVVGDYMIGLDCTEADGALRAQLDLGETGLVVRSPLEKSPAAEAGFQAYDVLIKAGDDELKSVQDLLDAVQAAEGKALSITLLRGGKEQTLEVTPVKRMDVTVPPPGADPKDIDVYIRQRLDEADVDHDVRLHTLRMRAVRPGVVLDRIVAEEPGALKEFEVRIQKLTEQVEALQQALEELKEKGN